MDAQVNISQKTLRETPVAYPPLTERRSIVAELDALLPAILDRAFKREL